MIWWLHRVRGGWRCAVGIHRWRGRRPHGIYVEQISGYRPPEQRDDFRVCDWCGATSRPLIVGDTHKRFGWGLVWGPAVRRDLAVSSIPTSTKGA